MRSILSAAAMVAGALILAGCAPDGGSDDASAASGDESAVETAYHRPVFSPDGRRIVFMRQGPSTGGDWELFVANEDGSGVRRLTNHPGWDGYAAFAPDGARITFDRDEGQDTKKHSVVMDLDTGATTDLGEFEGWLAVNAWSPSGDVLYAFWEKGGQRDIYALDTDGAVLEQITDTPEVSEHDIQVSRDGTMLIFSTQAVDGSGSGIDRIDLTTGERTTLVTSPGRAYGVAISPDAHLLAYNDDAPGGEADAELYLLDLETGEKRQLTDNDDWDHMPVFHPSGDYLLFTSYRSGQEAIYRMDVADGAVSAFEFRD